MDELERTENRFRPYRTRMYELLRQDPEYTSATDQQNDQMMITRVTSVMHTLSHVQHALSDAVINLGQSRPRHLRARPLMIQSRVQSTVIPNPINIGGLRTSSASRASSASNSTSTSTATTTTAASAASAATSNSSSSAEASGTAASAPSGLGALEGQLAGAFGEVEVSVEPIIVGIEVDSGIPLSSLGIPMPGGGGAAGPNRNQSGNGATAGGTNGQPMNHQNLINPIMNAIIMNAARAQGLAAASSTSTSASSATTSDNQSSGQDSQARGAGPQTQPTTSTQTRSSTHVDYVAGRVPRRTIRHRQFGIPQLSAGPSFDPLLPCSSHHITGLMNGRRSGSLLNQRPRSASVPPRRDQRANTPSSNNQQPSASSQNNLQASSARSSPQRLPRTPSFGNLDFEVSTHIDVVPMMMTPQGMVPLGSASTGRSPLHRPPSTATTGGSSNSEAMEPSLAHLLGALQTNANNEDANMFQVVMVSFTNKAKY